MEARIIDLITTMMQLNTDKDHLRNSVIELSGLLQSELNGFSGRVFEQEDLKSWLFSSTRYHEGVAFKVILNAHLDVVPAKDELFKPYVKDGKLYGRGAYDMKAAAIVEMLVFKELADTLSYPLGLQLVTDEEVGGFKGTKYQVDQGVRADFVIVGEPTNLAIGHKAKGILWLKVVFKGESAHGAYLWQGKSAVWEMERFLADLKKVYPVPNEEVWQTTVNVASVTTENTAFNKVPDKCEVKLDVRFVPEDKDYVVNKIKTLLSDTAEMEVIIHESSQYTEQDNDYLVGLQNACAEVTGKPCDVIARHGGSDLRFFDAVGCKGVEFGPVGYGHHTDEEWVDVESLVQYYEVLRKFLLSVQVKN